MEPIRSPRNPAVVEAGRLHRSRERQATGLTLVEGPHALEEALAAAVEVQRTFVLPDDPRRHDWPNAVVVDDAIMRKLAATETPRGPVAVVAIPEWVEPAPDRDLLVLMGVADPGNVGTIIRSAAAFGLGVVVGPGTADPWSPKVVRAGAGAHFRLGGLSRITDVEELTAHRLAATVVRGGIHPAALGPGPWAFLIGSEAHGLDPAIVGAADQQVTIPMRGNTESLNAAVAASILAYIAAIGSEPRSAAH
ncbi:MAG TPA: RNA methyltransferase [Acidimicrobiia bacterium]|nr:RNA methyltransferase [Acidimicrobiia bacterium]